MRTIAALVASVAVLAATPPADAVTSSVETSTRLNVSCDVDSRYLPRTADAAASWMAGCYEVERLPRTADAVTGWLG